MIRDEAYQILTTYLKSPNLIKHSLATETTMKVLYRKIMPQPYDQETEEKWGITGLLHDADYELAKGQPQLHGLLLFDPDKIGVEKEPNAIPKDVAYAIKSHNYQNTKVIPQTLMDWAITTCDQLTGLIVACALVRPDKKLFSLTPEFVFDKLNDKSFAKGANRKSIILCEEKLGIPILDFIAITLTAMQGIASQLEL